MDEEIIVEEEVIIIDEHSADDEAAKASAQAYQDAIATNDPDAPTGEEPVTDVDGTPVSQSDMPASGVWPGQPADGLTDENLAATPADVTEGVQGADGGEPEPEGSGGSVSPSPAPEDGGAATADQGSDQTVTTEATAPAAEPEATAPGAEAPTPPEAPQEPSAPVQ